MPDQPPQPYCDDELRTVVVRVQRAFNVAEIEGQCSDEESKTVPLRLAATLDHLKVEIARKDAALQFYSRDSSYPRSGIKTADDVLDDRGSRARSALATAPPPQKV